MLMSVRGDISLGNIFFTEFPNTAECHTYEMIRCFATGTEHLLQKGSGGPMQKHVKKIYSTVCKVILQSVSVGLLF